MRSFFLTLVFLWVSHFAFGQITDSRLTMPTRIHGFIETKTQTINVDQILDNIFFNESKESAQEYLESRVQHFSLQTLAPAALIIEEIDEALMDFGRGKITGPSQFDSRIEIRSLNPLIGWQQQVLNNESSVGIIIEREMISKVTDSVYHLDISSTLGSLYNLCAGEPFRDQPVVGVGTAFFVSDRLMITASHVFSRPIENYAIVFNFELVNKVGSFESFISSNNIFYPHKIIYQAEDIDVSVFSIDRPTNNKVLSWGNSKVLADNTSVYMIGHPMGLPKKAAFNARIKSNDHPLFFNTSLDAFQGNSGSPVFQLDTHEIIGVLISGELDYKWNGSCNASTLCSIPYCQGERVIRIEEIMNEINLLMSPSTKEQ